MCIFGAMIIVVWVWHPLYMDMGDVISYLRKVMKNCMASTKRLFSREKPKEKGRKSALGKYPRLQNSESLNVQFGMANAARGQTSMPIRNGAGTQMNSNNSKSLAGTVMTQLKGTQPSPPYPPNTIPSHGWIDAW